jgi:hypothetical protein
MASMLPVATTGTNAGAPIELAVSTATKDVQANVDMSATGPALAAFARFEPAPQQANRSVQPSTGPRRLPSELWEHARGHDARDMICQAANGLRGPHKLAPAPEERAIEAAADHCGDEAADRGYRVPTSSKKDDSSIPNTMVLPVAASPSTPTLDDPNDQPLEKRPSSAPEEPPVVSRTVSPGVPEQMSQDLLEEPSPWAETHTLLPKSIDIIRSLNESFGVTLGSVTRRSKSNQPFTAMTVLNASTQNNRIQAAFPTTAGNFAPILMPGDVVLSCKGQALAGRSFQEALELLRSSTDMASDGFIHCRMQVARKAVPQVERFETPQDFDCPIAGFANNAGEAGSANADSTILAPEARMNGSNISRLAEHSNDQSVARNLPAPSPAIRQKRKTTSFLAICVTKKFKHHSTGPRQEPDGILVQDAQVVAPAPTTGIHEDVAPEPPAPVEFIRGLSLAVESCFDQILWGGFDRARAWEKSVVGRHSRHVHVCLHSLIRSHHVFVLR